MNHGVNRGKDRTTALIEKAYRDGEAAGYARALGDAVRKIRKFARAEQEPKFKNLAGAIADAVEQLSPAAAPGDETETR